MLLQAEQEVVEEVNNNNDGEDDWTRDESRRCFSPDYNNVLFASALDGWAFGYTEYYYLSFRLYPLVYLNRINHFADIYAKKLSIKRETLMKTLWGDYYFDKKTKRVYKGAQVRSLFLIKLN